MEFLIICVALDLRGDSLSIPKVCTLAEKFYHTNFSEQERA
jgi:hypothetical protein